jgi:GNAT superfamily N-acetyltransferase
MTAHGHGHDHAHAPGPVADASVRVARASDAPAVGLVQSVVYRRELAGVVPEEALAQLEGPALAAVWRRALEGPAQGAERLFVALAGAQVVGFAAVGPSQDPDGGPTTGELTNLCVHPDARRQGHGSRLVNAAVDGLRAAGATEVVAWVLANADTTRAFLTGSGFGPDGAHRERVVGADGQTASEVRLVATIDVPADSGGAVDG